MTKIEWTHLPGFKGETWNPVVGCSLENGGCTNCYAMRMAGRIARMGTAPHYDGLTKKVNGKDVWTGDIAEAPESVLTRPLHWRKPRCIFVNSMGDLFHENVTDEQIDRVFAVMALCPQHIFIVLTKRSKRMREYVQRTFEPGNDWLNAVCASFMDYDNMPQLDGLLLENVWLGVSISDQPTADEHIPNLLATPAAKRLVSYEPALGPVDLEAAWQGENALDLECWGDCGWCKLGFPALHNCKKGKPSLYEGRTKSGLDWVIAGGESGPGARPAHPDWFRSVRDQCAAAKTPFFFKQWGELISILDRDADDPDWRAGYSEYERNGCRVINLEGGQGFHGFRIHIMNRVGKARAGNTLDGRQHQEFPEVP